nr:MAG TPA: hypothetical protein [Caudoviricetes sp.]
MRNFREYIRLKNIYFNEVIKMKLLVGLILGLIISAPEIKKLIERSKGE